MTDRELMQQALDALEWCYDVTEWPANGKSAQDKAIESLRARLANEFNPDWDAMAVMVEEQQRMAKRIEELEAALAQPEQKHSEQWWKHEVSNAWAEGYEKGRLQREFKGLTEGETIDLALSAFALPEVSSETREKIHRDLVIAMNDQDSRLMLFAANIEAKLKEKNT